MAGRPRRRAALTLGASAPRQSTAHYTANNGPEGSRLRQQVAEAGCCTHVDGLDRPHFHVYVIELAGSDGKPTIPSTLYVGQTALTPAERYAQHRSGIRASRAVRHRALWLRPRLFEHWNPLQTRAESERMERALADRLRAYGYTVEGGH